MRDVWSAAVSEPAERYEAMCAGFRWQIPYTFNFAIDIIDRWASDRDGPALLWENANGEKRAFTYSELSRLSCQLANVLRDRGVEKGDRVIIMLPRVPEWFVSIIAAMRIGAVPIPCIEMLTARDVEYRVRNAEVKAAICRPEHTEKFAAFEDVIPVRIALGHAESWLDWGEEVRRAPDQIEAATVRTDDPAIMYYTSGSTDHPKAVVHAARAIYAWRVSAIYWLDLRPGEVIWCTADTGWSKAGTSIIFGPLSCGACSFFFDGPFDSKQRRQLLRKHGISVYCAPATELLHVVKEVQRDEHPVHRAGKARLHGEGRRARAPGRGDPQAGGSLIIKELASYGVDNEGPGSSRGSAQRSRARQRQAAIKGAPRSDPTAYRSGTAGHQGAAQILQLASPGRHSSDGRRRPVSAKRG